MVGKHQLNGCKLGTDRQMKPDLDWVAFVSGWLESAFQVPCNWRFGLVLNVRVSSWWVGGLGLEPFVEAEWETQPPHLQTTKPNH